MSALGPWDLDLSYARGTITLRRKRPDIGPGIEEVRTYPIDVAIGALVATSVHNEASAEKEAMRARAERVAGASKIPPDLAADLLRDAS